jgi:tetratricopeptide (TPR) repeat protein
MIPAAFNGRVFTRLALLLLAASLALVAGRAVVGHLYEGPPGDYEVRQGDILLTDGNYQAALERFDKALTLSPDHRGALMGKAIAYLQSEHRLEAEATFTHLIDVLGRKTAGDPSARDVLAGAYANRGILYDRSGRYEQALADYRRALATDAAAVKGPGVIDRVLYGNAHPSTVRDRADYLERQLALPESERLLRVPNLDGLQRMYKP